MKYRYPSPRFFAMLLVATFLTSPAWGEARSFLLVKDHLIHQQITPVPALPDSTPLSKNKVWSYIKTRIATAQLQNKMRANAGQYDNLIQAFYEKRKELLNSRGWTEKEFEAIRDRIFAVESAMDMADDLAEQKEKHEKEIAKIRANKHFSEEQKEKMIEAMDKLYRFDKKQQFIESTKPDWPAVQPFREELKQLTNWIAGNISEPPQLD